jgi:hypothetical protein
MPYLEKIAKEFLEKNFIKLANFLKKYPPK